MKVLSLNVFRGCKEPARFRRLIKLINSQSPDVLGLLELNGWEENDFAKLKLFSKKTGFKFKKFCKSPHGYHLALFSRQPMGNVRLIQRGLWHGAILADIKLDGQSYTFATTHLCPKTEDQRLEEAKIILARLGNKPCKILMGDMNSLSPLDSMDERRLLKSMGAARSTKFGKTKLRKDTIRLIMRSGFTDTLTLFPTKVAIYTVPTKYNMDAAHFGKLHLDYLFVSSDIKTRVATATVVRNALTNTISDHYPIVAKLD